MLCPYCGDNNESIDICSACGMRKDVRTVSFDPVEQSKVHGRVARKLKKNKKFGYVIILVFVILIFVFQLFPLFHVLIATLLHLGTQ